MAVYYDLKISYGILLYFYSGISTTKDEAIIMRYADMNSGAINESRNDNMRWNFDNNKK